MEDFTPQTQPDGALVPPRKVPGTALAVATPPPPRNFRNRTLRTRNPFAQLVTRTFDAVDELADTIADSLGLRPR